MARTMTPEDIQTLVTRLRSSVDARMRGTLGQLAEQRKVQIGVLEREQELVAEPESSRGRKLALRRAGIRRQAQLAAVQHRTADLGAKLRKGEATITGRVTDTKSRPLPGVRVAIAGLEERGGQAREPAVTDDNGFYAIRLPRRQLAKHLETAGSLELSLTGGPSNLDLTVKRPVAERPISRRVLDLKVARKRRIVSPVETLGAGARAARKPAGQAKESGRTKKAARPAPEPAGVETAPGIGPARGVALAGGGIKTRKQLAAAKPARVAKLLGVSKKVAAKLVKGAGKKKG